MLYNHSKQTMSRKIPPIYKCTNKSADAT
jgi:hypothetical protein